MSQQPPLERSQLRAPFVSGCKPPDRFGVGLEYERFGIVRRAGESGGAVLPIEGPVSVTAILQAMIQRFGWTPKLYEGRLIELSRGEQRITLEPGGQMELSGAIHKTVDEAAEEVARYVDELRSVSEPLGIQWLASGTHPTTAVDAIPWLPKTRYVLMKQALPARGARAHQMMKGTCGCQVNLDFVDEADAMAKFRVAMGLTPIVAAMFANSSITAGAPNGFATQRFDVWLDTDPDRCGVLPFAFSPSASFDDYIEWALDVPLLFLVREKAWLPVARTTFRQFTTQGYKGHAATAADWQLHLTTLFPDVRLKAYIELRGTDSVPPRLALAHAALWKGLIYGEKDVLDAAFALVAGLGWEERLQLRSDVCRLGLKAMAGGRSVHEIALDLIGLARRGLGTSGDTAAERRLDPLAALTARGVTPGDEALARLRAGGPAAFLDGLSVLDLETA